MEDAERIASAHLSWRDGQPFAEAFQDIYHDRDGIGEVERVFLAPAGLPEGLQGRASLRVGELGFGTGLNFAVLARHCLAAGVRLDFVTVEAAPVAPADFARIAAERAAREPMYEALAPHYPPLLRGWHRRTLAGGRVTLHAYWGDGAAGLAELEAAAVAPMDLWLLDGFAPDRNPALWVDELLGSVGRLSARGTAVTTFTAAGRVRRGLAAAGFDMRRVDQRPHKRESLAGIMAEGPGPYETPALVHVIGAGIAGAATARRLAERDISVVVSEAEAPAAGASAIPVTVMHPRLHHDGSPPARLKALAYTHALSAVAGYLEDPESGISRQGALQVPSPNYPVERLLAVAERYGSAGLGVAALSGVEAAAACTLEGFTLPGQLLHFTDACLVDTPRFTRFLLDHPKIEVRERCPQGDWPGAPAVLACGMGARAFPGAGYLELGAVTGQIDLVALPARSGPLTTAIVGHGYLAPLPAGSTAAGGGNTVGVGATYEYEPWTPARATAANLEHVRRLTEAEGTALAFKKGERCTSSDRNPVAGCLTTVEGAPYTADDSEDGGAVGMGNRNQRLVNLGHGSMGTVTAHLGAAIIESLLLGLPPVLDRELGQLVDPARFRARQARRGYRFGAVP